ASDVWATPWRRRTQATSAPRRSDERRVPDAIRRLSFGVRRLVWTGAGMRRTPAHSRPGEELSPKHPGLRPRRDQDIWPIQGVLRWNLLRTPDVLISARGMS